MQPVHGMESRSRQQSRMLQIALAPTAIACDEVDQRGRRLLEAATEIRGQVHGVARPAHEGGLDEIVAEYVTAQRRRSRQVREPAVHFEGCYTNDRIVSVVIAFATLQTSQACAQSRTIA